MSAFAPAKRLACNVVRSPLSELAVGPVGEPGQAHVDRKAPMHDRAPHCVRRQCEAHSRDIPETWPRCAGEDVCCAGPVRRPQQLVPTDPGQQRAASRDLEERSVEVGVERPEQPVAFEKLSRHRPDAVELLTELESHPVVEVQMSDDELLPVGLRQRAASGKTFVTGTAAGAPLVALRRRPRPAPQRSRARPRN